MIIDHSYDITNVTIVFYKLVKCLNKKALIFRGASKPFRKYYAFYLKNYRKTIDFFGVQFFLFFKKISYQCLSKYSSFYFYL